LSIRVYIADDSTDLIRVLEQAIGSEPGFEVVGLSQAFDKLPAELTRIKPDILVLDRRMGGVDAFDHMHSLRALVPTMKIIVFSGFDADEQMEQLAATRGAQAYLTKGCDLDVLFETLNRVASS